MYRADGRWVVSASDLVGYLECGHLNGLSMAHALGELEHPPPDSSDDDALEVVRRRGFEHEQRYLDSLRAEDRWIVEIPESRGVEEVRHAASVTRQAIADGADVIFQATFFDESGPLSWRGHADFLERVPDVKSDSGSFVYEPVDTKLAHSVKTGAVLQLCQYASQLTAIQRHEPRLLHIELGDGERASFRYASVAAYYRHARRRFETAILVGHGETIYPEPVAHCSVCVWASRCDQRRRADDHLSFVPNLGRDHVRKLVAAGIPTVAELARTTVTSVPHIGDQVVERFQRQARLQVVAREAPAGPPPFELIEPSGPGRGLEGLPVPSAGDLYLDLEGDPFVGNGGLEYLFGIGWLDESGEFQFKAFWGHDDIGERAAFEGVVDFIVDRRGADPDLHVYHYAAYERTAFGRLMGKYGTREDEVDDLLRGRVLVDLFKVVRQGVRVGVESYSIKKLEPLYMAPRDGAITDAGSSIVEYERWLETHDPQILFDIEKYNRDDCESTWRLHHWLEARRAEAEQQFDRPLERPVVVGSVDDALDDTADGPSDLHGGCAGDLLGPPDRSSATKLTTPDGCSRTSLEWHRREVKPEWWRYFDIVTGVRARRSCRRQGLPSTGSSTSVSMVAEKHSLLHRYRFDPEQEHKIKVGDRPPDPARGARRAAVRCPSRVARRSRRDRSDRG